jgi:hypothetical protein
VALFDLREKPDGSTPTAINRPKRINSIIGARPPLGHLCLGDQPEFKRSSRYRPD